jgi:hypothetical protein
VRASRIAAHVCAHSHAPNALLAAPPCSRPFRPTLCTPHSLCISDGSKFHKQAMLATQLYDKLKSGELKTLSVIRLNDFICNVVNGRRCVWCCTQRLFACF